MHHHGVDHSLHNRALSLAEALLLPAASAVGRVGNGFAGGGDVIDQRVVGTLNIREGPLSEQEDVVGLEGSGLHLKQSMRKR